MTCLAWGIVFLMAFVGILFGFLKRNKRLVFHAAMLSIVIILGYLFHGQISG